jgi:hypothetical protein
MWSRVTLVRIDVSEESVVSIIMLVTTNVVPSSPILVTLMEVISSSETSILTRVSYYLESVGTRDRPSIVSQRQRSIGLCTDSTLLHSCKVMEQGFWPQGLLTAMVSFKISSRAPGRDIKLCNERLLLSHWHSGKYARPGSADRCVEIDQAYRKAATRALYCHTHSENWEQWTEIGQLCSIRNFNKFVTMDIVRRLVFQRPDSLSVIRPNILRSPQQKQLLCVSEHEPQHQRLYLWSWALLGRGMRAPVV